VNDNVNVTSWLILSITADPTSILNGGNATVTVDLLHANNGTIQDPANGHVPDGIPVTFTGTLGTLNSSTLLNGQATSKFTANSAGTGSITATIDNQALSTPITVRTPPTVTVIDPTNNAVNVAINKVIKVTFNQAIKAGTGWIELVNNNNTTVTVPIRWNINGNVLTVTSNNTLAHGFGYRLLIHTGSITNLAGDNVAGYVSRFTTSSDVTAPTVKTVDPTNNAVNVAADKVIKVTFSEAITEGTGWIELTTSNGTIVPSTFSINGNVLTIKANSTLTHGVKYNVLIHTGSVTDMAGNNVKGYVSRFTVDTIAPTVKTVDPTNKAVNVATNKVIKVTFNEAITTGTKWIELVASNGTSVTVNLTTSGNVLTITPTSALSKGTQYSLLIHTGSVTDLAGNNITGYVTRFTTTA
jgi:methionine-rich copper-binding protein CopC